jgi:2-keto-4-pentenoate hydratase
MTDIVAATVRALVHARQSHQPIAAADLPLPDAESAYAVQAGVAAALGGFSDGGPAHWKSGGASRESLQTHALLPSRGVHASPADGRAWPLVMRGIEAEVALRIGRDVEAETAIGLDLDAASALVDAMCVSIELVESRWMEGLDAPPWAKLADMQSHGGLVLGEWMPFTKCDWSQQVCRVTLGDRPPVERRGSHAMADPAFVLPAWLRHATRAGASVRQGTVITTGTWCGVLHAAAGDLVIAAFPGIGQAAIQL